MDALLDAQIHTGNAVLTDSAVLIEGGSILGMVPRSEVPAGAARNSLGGGVLAPGFIDLQVNGGGGVLFNDRPDVEGIRAIVAAHRRFGTTALLPTFITDSRDTRARAVEAVAAALAAGEPGVLGIHLEGPHIDAGRRGVHDARFIAPPDEEDLALMTRPGLGRTLVTLAPETVPAGVIRALAARGVRICAGHTAATWEQMEAGIEAGVSGVTHLYNAMSPLGHREPGAAGAALADDRLWCGIIVDGHHVHDAAVRLAWKAKPAGKLFLVTDAMPPVGAPPGDFHLYGATVTVRDGRCVSADGRLAGSALDMAAAVRNCVRRIGIPLDEALRMAAAYPADFLGVADRRGRLLPGLAADLVHLDDDLRPLATWVAGKMERC
ncbi:N-acetylglucosamine-6-phosphate deacetylase [Azospirillum sp.]|uniref:N-acetylglucosamine-6-phosphate deacetylase n=1 Tax=Azospirillum sp. TaxID=34012 RepID=UPI003D70B063